MRIKNRLNTLRTLPPRITALLAALTMLAGLSFPLITPRLALAASAQLRARTLSISSSANGTITQDIAGNAVAAGAGGNGQKTKHTFSFKLKTTQNIGSILIKYCTDPIPQATCTTPTGMDAANVTSIVTQSNFTGGAFSLDTTTDLSALNCNGTSPFRENCIAIKRGSPGAETDTVDAHSGNEAATATVSLAFGGGASDYIKNPTTDNYQFYARITTYTDTAFTTLGDYGSVAASTAQQIDITAKVKEVLNFSVGDVTSLVAPTGVCTPLGAGTSGAIALGDTNGVLSFTQAYDAHSYFRLSTNTNGGVKIYYSGDTLKNGSNSIAAAGLTAVSSGVNTSQFGLAIDSSDTQGGNGYDFNDGLTAETAGTSPNGTDYSSGNGTITNGGSAKFGYNTASTTTPELLAHAVGAVACDTGSVRYIGNISTAVPAGIYTTTITYIATGTY